MRIGTACPTSSRQAAARVTQGADGRSLTSGGSGSSSLSGACDILGTRASVAMLCRFVRTAPVRAPQPGYAWRKVGGEGSRQISRKRAWGVRTHPSSAGLPSRASSAQRRNRFRRQAATTTTASTRRPSHTPALRAVRGPKKTSHLLGKFSPFRAPRTSPEVTSRHASHSWRIGRVRLPRAAAARTHPARVGRTESGTTDERQQVLTFPAQATHA